MKPLVKWAGGKSLVYKDTSVFFPKTYSTYVEPFLGGGAVLFNLAPDFAIVGDANPHLVNFYYMVSKYPSILKYDLDELTLAYSREKYFEIRNQFNHGGAYDSLKKAAHFLFLNKTCFNGLWRVNKSGHFNVPFGQRKKCPALYDEVNLREVSKYLSQSVKIIHQDFKATLDLAPERSFVYLDPPYLGDAEISHFTSYTAKGFSLQDYQEMIELCHTLVKQRGTQVVVSNSMDNPGLFKGFRKHEISRRTSISGHTKVRKASPEYIYTLGF